MERMQSDRLNDAQRDGLLQTARRSIEHGLAHGTPLTVQCSGIDPALAVRRASFVTLEKRQTLRGCIGSIEAYRPLLEDVAHNAFAAAFEDPRFAPVTADEWPELTLSLSLLTQPRPFPVKDRQDLLNQLRPGVDGLILREGRRSATFLPSVWESLATPELFVSHLLVKGGWPADYWSDRLEVSRYETETVK
jgi:AmmeMemoRadiSam system protein A